MKGKFKTGNAFLPKKNLIFKICICFVESYSSGSSIVFECSYSTSIDVTSADFNVTKVSAKGETGAVGNLDSGFSLKLNNNTEGGAVFELGSILEVEAVWQLNIENLNYYFLGCNLEQESDITE